MAAYIIGLTGGIGSGKSSVTALFSAAGAAVVDTDTIAHQLTAPGGAALPALVAAFGTDILTTEGALDRPAMRHRVFSHPADRARLEGILHPLIRREAQAACHAATSAYVVLAVPLLVETGHWHETCDRILVIDCPETLQIERVMARNAMSEDEVKAILAAQATRPQRLAIADDVIDNQGPLAALAPQVQALHRTYLAHAAKKAHADH